MKFSQRRRCLHWVLKDTWELARQMQVERTCVQSQKVGIPCNRHIKIRAKSEAGGALGVKSERTRY